jgi:hypothetical protein
MTDDLQTMRDPNTGTLVVAGDELTQPEAAPAPPAEEPDEEET